MLKMFSYRKDEQRNDVIGIGKFSIALTGGDETVPLRTLTIIVASMIVATVILLQVILHLIR